MAELGEAYAALPDQAPLVAVVKVGWIPLGEWWPDQPATARAVYDAVDRLRYLTKNRRSMIDDARRLVEHGLAD